MKQLIVIISIILTYNANAQLVIDDFSQGTFNTQSFTKRDNDQLYKQGSKIAGTIRRINPIVSYNPLGQSLQVNVKNGTLNISFPYDTRGTVQVGYGFTKSGNKPMNLNASKYKKLRIQFAAKSTINGLNITFYGSDGRSGYSKHAIAREGKFIHDIMVNEIKNSYKNFKLSDIDYLLFQFDARSKTGCNMAIDKIWFE